MGARLSETLEEAAEFGAKDKLSNFLQSFTGYFSSDRLIKKKIQKSKKNARLK